MPEDLREQTVHLAKLLVTADTMSSAIRRRAIQSISPAEHPDLRIVGVDALAFLFREKFGRSAPDYVIREAFNACEDLKLSSLEGFTAVLQRKDLRVRLAAAYGAIMPVPLGPENEFLAMLHAFARGDRHAINQVRRKARREFREIDAVYRRELMSSLPDSIDELIVELEGHGFEPDVESWARALDAGLAGCRVCGTRIIEPGPLADAIVRHYNSENPDEVSQRLVSALYQSGIECGGADNDSLCSYHDYQAGRD